MRAICDSVNNLSDDIVPIYAQNVSTMWWRRWFVGSPTLDRGSTKRGTHTGCSTSLKNGMVCRFFMYPSHIIMWHTSAAMFGGHHRNSHRLCVLVPRQIPELCRGSFPTQFHRLWRSELACNLNEVLDVPKNWCPNEPTFITLIKGGMLKILRFPALRSDLAKTIPQASRSTPNSEVFALIIHVIQRGGGCRAVCFLCNYFAL